MSTKPASSFNMTTTIVTLLTGIIVASYVFWLNKEKYDLRYTLSEKIPIRFGAAQEEAVQQIEVKNLSKKPVEKIQVKLPPRLTTHEIIKNSIGDKIEIFNDEKTFEIIYPSLPPQGAFRLVFKTTGDGITKEELIVRHSKGNGEYALGNATGLSSAISLVSTGAAIVYMLLCLNSIKGSMIRSWETDAEYKGLNVLKASKPFYIPEQEWANLRKKAVLNLANGNSGYGLNVSESEIYKFLDREKPEFMTEEEWTNFCSIACKQIWAGIVQGMDEAWSTTQMLKFFRIKKPLLFSKDKWEDLRLELQKRFLKLRMDDSSADLISMLKQHRPADIDEEAWNENQHRISEKLLSDLYSKIRISDSPLDYLATKDLSVLSKDNINRLQAEAYRLQSKELPNVIYEPEAKRFLKQPKPSWLNETDYSKHKTLAENVLQVGQDKRTNELLRLSLRKIVDGFGLADKELEGLDEELRVKLKKLDTDIRTVLEKNRADSERNSKESKQLLTDREKVLKQLKILESLLHDPSSIDRIESYDNPFAPGNFELLKTVAACMRGGGRILKK